MGVGFQLRECAGVGEGEAPDCGAAEGGDVPTNVKGFPQVPSNGSNICSRRAVNSDIHVDEPIVVVEAGGGELADGDFPGGDGDGFAGAHPFVGAFAVDFDGADRGGSLHNASNKLGKCGGDIVVGEVGCVGTAYFGAFGVIGGGGHAEPDGGLVGFRGGNKVGEEFCAPVYANNEHPGGERIKGSGMPDASGVEDATQPPNDIV